MTLRNGIDVAPKDTLRLRLGRAGAAPAIRPLRSRICLIFQAVRPVRPIGRVPTPIHTPLRPVSRRFAGLALLPILLLAGCGTLITPHEVNLTLSGRYQEVITLIEGKEAQGQPVSQRERFTLCEAYLQTSVYNKLFACADALDRQIAAESGATWVIGIGTLATKSAILRARAHLELGNLEQATAEAEKAYRLDPRSDSDRFTALALLAYAAERAGRPEQAAAWLDRLEKEPIHFMGWGIQVLEKRKAKAFAQFSLRRYQAFLAEGEEGLAKFLVGLADVTGDPHQTYSVEFPVRFARAKACFETGRQAEAMAIYRDLLAHPQVRHWGNLYWQILFDQGRHALQAGRRAEGIGLLEQAVAAIEEKRSSIDIDAARIGFVGDKQEVYHRLIDALVREGRAEKAFEYAERAKSRALVDLLAAKRDFAVRGDARAVRTVLAQSDAAEAAVLLRTPAADREGTRSLQIRTREALAQQAPELASLVTVTSPSAAALLAMLPPGEALVEFYYREEDLYAFTLAAGALQAERLDGRGLAAEVEAFRRVIDGRDAPATRELARRLYDRLFGPLARHLTAPRLVVVPHGALHYLPLNALHDGERYLIDRHALRVMPSAGAMAYLGARRAAERPGGLLVLGNPDLGDPRYDLAHAQQEAAEIARLVPRARVLVRKAATAAAFRREARDYRYLHFATHGQFQPDKPLQSALLLAPEGGDDGMLTADKLYALDLDADLVTLSACETGLSRVANGDDLVGLTRGFLYAGARSLVASLWKVDDRATAELMIRFYRELGKTDKREALRRAQIETRDAHPHPYYWASFQLTGSAE